MDYINKAFHSFHMKSTNNILDPIRYILSNNTKNNNCFRSYGTTVYAALMEDGREVAVKEVLKKGRQWKKSMQEEVDILVQLGPHKNVVSYKVIH